MDFLYNKVFHLRKFCTYVFLSDLPSFLLQQLGMYLYMYSYTCTVIHIVNGRYRCEFTLMGH